MLVLWGLRRGGRLSESGRGRDGCDRVVSGFGADVLLELRTFQRRYEIGDGKEFLVSPSECDDHQAVIGIRTR